MRAALAACLCFALLGAACSPPDVRHVLAAPAPTATAAPTAPSTPTAVAQSISAAATPPPRAARPSSTPTSVAADPSATQVPAPQPVAPAPVLDGLLDGLLPDGTSYGVVLEDLASGARTAVNDTTTYPSASLYKLAVAWVVLRQVDTGALNLDSTLDIEDDDTVEPEPYGGFGAGDTPTLREALGAMLELSSNAAAHALLRLVGIPAFTAEMDRIGLSQTRIPDDSVAVTTPADMAQLLRMIATSSDLSDASRELLIQDMANIAPPDALRDTLPDTITIFDKTGNLDDASNVGALLESPRATAILVVIDSGVDPGDARAVIAEAGRVAYRALLQ